MSHMVIFRTTEGKAGYHQAEALDEAVRFVERIRNEESVEQARIFRLQEVAFEFRPYFRVELTGAPADAAPQRPAAGNGDAKGKGNGQSDAPAEPAAESAGAGDADAPADAEREAEQASSGRKGLFR